MAWELLKLKYPKGFLLDESSFLGFHTQEQLREQLFVPSTIFNCKIQATSSELVKFKK